MNVEGDLFFNTYVNISESLIKFGDYTFEANGDKYRIVYDSEECEYHMFRDAFKCAFSLSLSFMVSNIVSILHDE